MHVGRLCRRRFTGWESLRCPLEEENAGAGAELAKGCKVSGLFSCEG